MPLQKRARIFHAGAISSRMRLTRSDEERYGRADQDVPRKCYGRKSPYAKNGGEAGEHAGERASRGGSAVERAEEKKAEEAAEGERGHGQAGFEERAPFDETEGHQDEAPNEGHAAREAQKLAGSAERPRQSRKIEDAGGGEGIEGAAGVGHGDGDDGGEKQAGKTGGHFADEKKRKDAVGALAGGEERRVLCEDVK